MTATNVPPPPSGEESGPGSVTFADDVSPDVIDYVSAVRAQLVDVDADELDDILDDLVSHLREVRAETDAPFAEVLGSPQAYAADLRASAGLAPVPPPPGPDPARRVVTADPLTRATGEFSDLARQVGQHPWWRAVVEFLPELRPAWWVLRAYLVLWLLAAITSAGQPRGIGSIIIPPFANSHLAGLVLLVPAVVFSVRHGRTGRSIRWPWFVVGALVFLSIAFFAVGASSYDGAVYVGDGPNDTVFDEAGPVPPYFGAGSSSDALNVYAYLPDGTRLDQVLLFDQNGNPLVLDGGSGLSSGGQAPFTAQVFDSASGEELEMVLPTDGDGRPVANLYPRKLYRYDYRLDGQSERRLVPRPAVDAELPGASTTTTTAPPAASTTTATAPPAASTTAVTPVDPSETVPTTGGPSST